MEKTTKIAKRFEWKVAIVTASTQGIGFGIAEWLGLEGASVVVSSRKQKNVDEAVEKLKAQGIEVLGVVCHVSSAEQRKNLIDNTVQRYGKVDVVVSNAAANPSIDPILQMQESVLDKLWEINVKSAILILKVYQRREHCKCDGSCSTPRECSYDCSTSRACLNRLPVGPLPPPNLC